MARSHARLMTSIWADRDFLARSGEAQRLYMMLLSQPDLGHAGKLSLTIRRWSRMRSDPDESVVRAALTELDASAFLVVDEDTEEVLVRSLIRNDGVWKQPKVLAVAIVEAARMVSPKIRARVFDELVRIDTSELPDSTQAAVKALLADLPDALTQAHLEFDPHPPQGGEHPPPHPPINGHPQGGAEGDRGTRTYAGGPSPYPSHRPPPPTVPPPAGAFATQPGTTLAAVPDIETPTAQTLIGEWLDHCQKRPPNNVIGQVGKHLAALFAEGIDPDDIRVGLAAWHNKALHPATLPSVVNEVMNASTRRPATARPTGNQDMLARAMERAQAKEASGL